MKKHVNKVDNQKCIMHIYMNYAEEKEAPNMQKKECFMRLPFMNIRKKKEKHLKNFFGCFLILGLTMMCGAQYNANIVCITHYWR